MREAGLSKEQLAECLGWPPGQVRRLFDGRHAVQLDGDTAGIEALLGYALPAKAAGPEFKAIRQFSGSANSQCPNLSGSGVRFWAKAAPSSCDSSPSR
jgi:hypothetical protein